MLPAPANTWGWVGTLQTQADPCAPGLGSVRPRQGSRSLPPPWAGSLRERERVPRRPGGSRQKQPKQRQSSQSHRVQSPGDGYPWYPVCSANCSRVPGGRKHPLAPRRRHEAPGSRGIWLAAGSAAVPRSSVSYHTLPVFPK